MYWKKKPFKLNNFDPSLTLQDCRVISAPCSLQTSLSFEAHSLYLYCFFSFFSSLEKFLKQTPSVAIPPLPQSQTEPVCKGTWNLSKKLQVDTLQVCKYINTEKQMYLLFKQKPAYKTNKNLQVSKFFTLRSLEFR